MKTAGVLIAISFHFMAMHVSALLLTQRRACAILVNERYDTLPSFRLTQRRVDAEITLLKLLPCSMGPYHTSLECTDILDRVDSSSCPRSLA